MACQPVTNEQVYVLHKTSGLNFPGQVRKLLKLCFEEEDDYDPPAVYAHMKRVVDKIERLKMDPKDKPALDKYFQEIFVPVKTNPNKSERKPELAECKTCEVGNSINKNLVREVASLKKALADAQAQLSQANQTVMKMRQVQPGRLNQRIKCLKAQLTVKRQFIKSLRDRLRPRWTPLPQTKIKKPPRKLYCEGCAHVDWSVKFRVEEMKNLKRKVVTLEDTVTTLRLKLERRDNQFRADNVINTKSDGKIYNDSVCEAIYACIDSGLSVTKLENCVRGVVRSLTGKELLAFPAQKKCRDIIRERGRPGKMQVIESDVSERKVKSEETSKSEEPLEAEVVSESVTPTVGVDNQAKQENLNTSKSEVRTFSSQLREAIYICIDNDVPRCKLKVVIRGVIQQITGKELLAFPDKKKCEEMILERCALDKMVGTKYDPVNKRVKLDGTGKWKEPCVGTTVAPELSTTCKKESLETKDNFFMVKSANTYRNQLRNAIYCCMVNDVALCKLEKVVRGIVRSLTGKELSAFPYPKTCRIMVREMGLDPRLNIADYKAKRISTDHMIRPGDANKRAAAEAESATLTIGPSSSARGTAA